MLFLNPVAQWTEKEKAAAETFIEGFYRIGGRFSPQDYKAMDPMEREIAVMVYRRIRLEERVLETGNEALAEAWAATLPKEERERILATLLSAAAARAQEGEKKT